MSPYKTTDTTPPTPEYPTPSRLSRLHEAGIKTDGHIYHLQTIIAGSGYNLPSQENENWGFVFRPTGSTKSYMRLYLSEVDACAEEILMLVEYKMI